MRVPICRSHHEDVERQGSRGETAWFENHGLDAIDLAGALWNASPDAAVMAKIVKAHRSH